MSKSNQFSNQFTERVMAKIQARLWLGRLRRVLIGLLVLEFFAVAIELVRNNIDLFPQLLIHDFQSVSSHFPSFVATLASSLPWLGLSSLVLTVVLYGLLLRYETIVGRNRITDTTSKGEFRMPLTIIGSTKRTIASGAALAVLFGGASVYAAVDNSNHQAAVHASQTAFVKTSTKAGAQSGQSDKTAGLTPWHPGPSGDGHGGPATGDGGNSTSTGHTAQAGSTSTSGSTSTGTTDGGTPILKLTGIDGHLFRQPFTPHWCSPDGCNTYAGVQGKVLIEHYVDNNPNAATVVIASVDTDENGYFRFPTFAGVYRLTGEDSAGNHTPSVNVNVQADNLTEVNLYFNNLAQSGM